MKDQELALEEATKERVKLEAEKLKAEEDAYEAEVKEEDERKRKEEFRVGSRRREMRRRLSGRLLDHDCLRKVRHRTRIGRVHTFELRFEALFSTDPVERAAAKDLSGGIAVWS